MNALNLAIKNALKTAGNLQEANKAYLEFIKANFIIPVEKNTKDPQVLFLNEKECVFLPAFSEKLYLDAWITEISMEVDLLKLSGVDLLKGIGDEVSICLDIDSEYYKEFNPAEIARMKSMVLKFFTK